MSPLLRSKKLNPAVLVLLVSIAVLCAVYLSQYAVYLSQYPVRQATDLRRQLDTIPDVQFERRVQLMQYETDNRIKIWTMIVQSAGGAAFLLGLFFTWRNLQATQAKLDIDRQGQLTSRFIHATDQLGAELKDGKPNVEVRLGAIYALKRISDDWPKDYWPIADVLTAYVRHNAQWNPSSVPPQDLMPRTDIQAILTVLGKTNRLKEKKAGGENMAPDDRHKFDLRNTNLRGAEFWDAHLEGTDFWGAHLERAQLWGAFLDHAKLDHAHLAGANLRGAKLNSASLIETDVKGAVFDEGTEWPAGFDVRASGAVSV